MDPDTKAKRDLSYVSLPVTSIFLFARCFFREKIGAKSLKGRGNGLEDFESWFTGNFFGSDRPYTAHGRELPDVPSRARIAQRFCKEFPH